MKQKRFHAPNAQSFHITIIFLGKSGTVFVAPVQIIDLIATCYRLCINFWVTDHIIAHNINNIVITVQWYRKRAHIKHTRFHWYRKHVRASLQWNRKCL